MDLKFRILVFMLQLNVAVSYKSYKFNKLCTTNPFKVFMNVLLNDKPNVELEISNELSAALISQQWDDETYKSVEYCDFKVITKTSRQEDTRGIFASIRRMNLRKGSSNNECVDYVVFEVSHLQKSQKFCGTINGDEVYDVSNFFEAPGGTMKVIVFINKYATLETNRQLGIELIFTSYDECSRNSLECDSKKCIAKELENDTILNCPPPDCRDEPMLADQCLVKQRIDDIEETPDPYVLAMTTWAVIVILIIFTCFAGVCCFSYEFRYCCTDRQTNSPNGNSRSGISRPRRPRPTEFQTELVESAPPLVRPPLVTFSHGHDSPPSYESLFQNKTKILQLNE